MSHDSRPAICLPLGVRDFLPRAAARRRAIAEKLLGAFEAWGYARIITPLFERAEVLERGLGADARAAAIRFVEPGTGEVVALRPDITPQIARIAATRLSEVAGPIRLCYEGAVTRMSTGARGQREILQAGVELIGADAPEGDAEVISVAAAALATLGIKDMRLDVGHVAPARHALGAVADLGQRRELVRLLAKKDRAGVASAATGLPAALQRILTALPTLWGAPADILRHARTLEWPAPVRAALDSIERILAMSREVIEAEIHAAITMDLGEVRGFEYYTGIRFAGYVDGVGDELLRGGRYDELVGRYGLAAHATGFAVDIEAAAQAQRAAGIEPPEPPTTVLIAATRARRSDASRIAAALRAQGRAAAVDLGPTRARTALLSYARAAGYTQIVTLGRDRAEVIDTTGGQAHPLSQATITRAIARDSRSLIKALETDSERLSPSPSRRPQ